MSAASSPPLYSWGDTYPFLEDYGQTVVGGRLSDVGSGLLLGGGLSYLSAEYGLGSDNFVSLEVVLPSGELVTATRHNEYSDLFWALKGCVCCFSHRSLHERASVCLPSDIFPPFI